LRWDDAGWEGAIPCCGLSYGAPRILSGLLSDEISRHVLDNGKIGGCEFGSAPTFIVPEDRVDDQVYAVFDCPMAADDGAYKACIMAKKV
jgi:hypothetical protein